MCVTLRGEDKRQQASVGAGDAPPSAGQNLWVNPIDGMEFVWVPSASRDTNGVSPNGPAAAEAGITNGFWLGRTEVTIAQFRRFMTATIRAAVPGRVAPTVTVTTCRSTAGHAMPSSLTMMTADSAAFGAIKDHLSAGATRRNEGNVVVSTSFPTGNSVMRKIFCT
jgi:formylglycine-generating enzyme required for sulfatase activity